MPVGRETGLGFEVKVMRWGMGDDRDTISGESLNRLLSEGKAPPFWGLLDLAPSPKFAAEK